jgi:hypothetical protein
MNEYRSAAAAANFGECVSIRTIAEESTQLTKEHGQ